MVGWDLARAAVAVVGDVHRLGGRVGGQALLQRHGPPEARVQGGPRPPGPPGQRRVDVEAGERGDAGGHGGRVAVVPASHTHEDTHKGRV